MNCLKCGRETPAEQVFCEECLLEMEKYPVKPGTVVLLPRGRDTVSTKKIIKRRVLSTEEQLKAARKQIKALSVAFLVMLLLALLMAYPSVLYLKSRQMKIGQNYTAIISTAAPSETADEHKYPVFHVKHFLAPSLRGLAWRSHDWGSAATIEVHSLRLRTRSHLPQRGRQGFCFT